MRLLAPALTALFVLSLPVLAQAGEGCPYSKDKGTTAAFDAPAADVAHHDGCSESCSEAGATPAGGACPCASEATAALHSGDLEVAQSSEAPADPTQSVGTTD